MCLVGNVWLLTRDDVVDGTRPIYANVTTVMREDACFPGGRLFVWGIAPQFYVESGLRPATRFVLPQETTSGYVPGRSDRVSRSSASVDAERHWNLLFEDLERNRATYILDTAPSGLRRWRGYPVRFFPRLAAYPRQHYEQMAVVDGVVIHRRHGCLAAVGHGVA